MSDYKPEMEVKSSLFWDGAELNVFIAMTVTNFLASCAHCFSAT